MYKMLRWCLARSTIHHHSTLGSYQIISRRIDLAMGILLNNKGKFGGKKLLVLSNGSRQYTPACFS